MTLSQLDLICTQCPLPTCNDESLWCVLRFITDPNDAQQAFVRKNAVQSHYAEKRRQYYASYYQKNREKKLSAAKERQQRLAITPKANV